MRPTFRRFSTWSLIGLLSLAWVVGEGWHFVPGNGHLVELPNGFVFVGYTCPHGKPAHDESGCKLGVPWGDLPSWISEDDCPICRLIAQSHWMAPVLLVPAASGYDEARPLVDAGSSICACLVFHARAPPVA